MKLLKASAYAFSLVPMVVFGQTAAPASDDRATLEEIVVTAQKRSENIQDVPIAITAVGKDALDALGISNAGDLNVTVASLNVQTSVGHALPSLRGVGTTVVGGGAENPVAFYVDGVYYADAVSAMLTFNNIAQIDVLKGPQGTLFGRNATGGLLQVRTLDPSSTPSMKGSVSYGNYDTMLSKLYVTGGLAPGVAGDLALTYSHQGTGYGTNLVTGRDANRTDLDFGARSKWRFEPADGTVITLIGEYAQTRGDRGTAVGIARRSGFGPELPAGANYQDILSDTSPFIEVQSGGGSVHLEQDLGSLHLVSITAYRKMNQEFFFDGDASAVPAVTIDAIDREHQFSQEVQLLSNNKGRFQWMVGGFYFNAQGGYSPFFQLNFAGQGVPAPLQPFFSQVTSEFITNQRTSSIAGFAEGKFDITNTTRLTLGARVTHETRKFDGTQVGFAQDGAIPLGNLITPINGATLTATRPTWRVILDQKISEDLLVYASYNRGFKSGTFNSTSPTDTPLKPEQLDAYETGFKATLLDDRLRFNGAAYYYDYGNYQAVSFANGAAKFFNASAKIYGAEAELEAAVTDKLRINTGVGWTHARYGSFPSGVLSTPGTATPDPTSGLPYGNIQTGADLSGNELPNVPSWTGFVGATYTIPVLAGKLAFDANYYYNNGWFGEPDNVLRQKSYHLVTASALWTSPSEMFTVRAWGKNLTDSQVANEISSSTFATVIDYQAPRTYGVELGFKF